MNMIRIFLFTLAFLLVSCHRSIEYSEQDHIINLGMPSWDRASKDFERGLFMYLSHPLCTPCKLPFEEFKLAAADLFEFQSNVQFAKVDCHDENGLCEFLHIDEYPTLLLYRAEKPFVEYRGLKKSQNITTWIKKVIDGQYEQFYDEKALFNRFSTALVISTQFPEEINIAYRSLVDDIQISLRSFPESATLPVLKVRDTGYILIQGKTEERFKIDETHNADWLKAKFKSILYEEKLAVPNFTPMHWKMLQSEQGHDFVFFFRTEKFDATSDATKSFDNVAMDKSDDDLLFTYVNVDEVIGDTVAKWFGVVNSDEPTVGILLKQGNIFRKYKLRTQITEESIKDLIKNYENDDERYYMSAPIPKAKENDIQELVGSNFKAVTGSGKNVLVLFYFHITAFSAQFDYIWKTLSYRFRKNPNLIIARIDMSQNDVEGVELQNYPVVRLYRSNLNYTDYPTSLPIDLKGIKDFLIENVPGIRTEIEL